MIIIGSKDKYCTCFYDKGGLTKAEKKTYDKLFQKTKTSSQSIEGMNKDFLKIRKKRSK